MLGTILRRYRDFPASEDAVQEALIAAATQWPGEGRPENPRGWLIQVAARRITDHVRAESARRHREKLVVSLVPADEQVALAADAEGAQQRDDTLDLLFMCCHPVLTSASAISLTLRAVGGLTTAEIARAFLVPEATMAQRISRAKQTIKESGEAFALPGPERLARRLREVLHVLYLDLQRGLRGQRGARAGADRPLERGAAPHPPAASAAPGEPEVAGLLALMLLTDARRTARTGPAGELIPLDKQDRTALGPGGHRRGRGPLSAALRRGALGPYQLQAAIAAVHDEAESAEKTDWPQILALYEVLGRISDNPLVALNRAIAVAMVQGPAAGLALLDTLEADPRLAGNHRLDAVRAHLLERAGDREGASTYFRRAAERTLSLAERNYLLTNAARLYPSVEEGSGRPRGVTARRSSRGWGREWRGGC